jgi:hypothetical protein
MTVSGDLFADWPRKTPRLKRGTRLYMCVGSPWNKAIDDLKSGAGAEDLWTVDRTYRQGDLILSLITTSPRMVVCLEVAAKDAADGPMIDITSDYVDFDNGILLPRVCAEVGFSVKSSGYYEGSDARNILKSLAAEDSKGEPWLTPRGWTALADDLYTD